MCLPYIIPDPPPGRKKPRNGRPLAKPNPLKGSTIQPSFIEISPRLTYVASPKPDRSPIPRQPLSSALRPPRPRQSVFLDDSTAGEQAARQEERRVVEEDIVAAETSPGDVPPEKTAAEEKPPQAQPAHPQRQCLPSSGADLVPPQYRPPPPPAPSPPRNPIESSQQRQPHHRPTRSPHSYVRRPLPHCHDDRRSRSLSSNSTISRRSFERLKRSINVLWDRVRALERWKEERENESRQRRRAWELGQGRREASLIRERRERHRSRQRAEQRERGRGREGEGERWDWEGGGLGRR